VIKQCSATPKRAAFRRALNGLRTHFRDLNVQPLPEPVGGRWWCLNGHAGDMSERLTMTTVIERWNGLINTLTGDTAESPSQPSGAHMTWN